MSSEPLALPSSPRLPPGLVDAATRHAHALRQQAIDDAAGRLAALVRRLTTGRPAQNGREAACLS